MGLGLGWRIDSRIGVQANYRVTPDVEWVTQAVWRDQIMQTPETTVEFAHVDSTCAGFRPSGCVPCAPDSTVFLWGTIARWATTMLECHRRLIFVDGFRCVVWMVQVSAANGKTWIQVGVLCSGASISSVGADG